MMAKRVQLGRKGHFEMLKPVETSWNQYDYANLKFFQQSSFIRFVNYYENGCENCEKGVSQFGTCNLSTSQHSFGFGNSRNLVN